MAFWKIVGFEVTPTTATSRISRSRSPSRSSGRERKSIQTLWPSADSWCSGESAIVVVPPGEVAPTRLPIPLGASPASTPGVSADQLLVLVLLAAAFAAGWVARGGRHEPKPEPRGAGEPATPDAPRAPDDP